jgi:hypothetical protein
VELVDQVQQRCRQACADGQLAIGLLEPDHFLDRVASAALSAGLVLATASPDRPAQ